MAPKKKKGGKKKKKESNPEDGVLTWCFAQLF
jgi:hypothetical protein